jgi:hypothetical protein
MSDYAGWAAWADSAETTARLNPSVGDYGAAPAEDAPDVAAPQPGPGAGGRGFPDWLPARSRRMILQEDREQARWDRAAERQRADAADAAHNRALVAWRARAELAGDVVTVQDMLNGEGVPTVNDVLTRVRDQVNAREAAAEAARAGRGAGPVEFLDLVPEPAPSARSATARALASRSRRFAEARDAARRAEAARTALEDDLPQLRDQSHRRRSRPAPEPARVVRDNPPADRIRHGGEILGISSDEAVRRAFTAMGGQVL